MQEAVEQAEAERNKKKQAKKLDYHGSGTDITASGLKSPHYEAQSQYYRFSQQQSRENSNSPGRARFSNPGNQSSYRRDKSRDNSIGKISDQNRSLSPTNAQNSVRNVTLLMQNSYMMAQSKSKRNFQIGGEGEFQISQINHNLEPSLIIDQNNEA